MQITIELRRALCKIDKENIFLIVFFILGYLIFSYINLPKNPLTEEQIARNYRKSIKYFNKHQAENDAFYFGLGENIDGIDG